MSTSDREAGLRTGRRQNVLSRAISALGWVQSTVGNLGEAGFIALLALTGALAIAPMLAPKLSPLPPYVAALVPFLLIGVRANVRMIRLHRDMAHDIRALETFNSNARRKWASLQPNPSAMISQRDVWDLVPAELREKAASVTPFLGEIANGKIYIIDAPNETVLRPYRDRVEGRHRDALSYGNLSIKLGILGTFVGFIFALFSLGASIGDISPVGSQGTDPADNWSALTQPMLSTLDKLAFAFLTSIFGLSLGIIISVQGSSGRRQLDRFYSRLHEGLSYGRMLVARMTLADPAVHSTLTQVKNALLAMDQRLVDHAEKVAAAMREHGTTVSAEADRFGMAAEAMVALQEKWTNAFDALDSSVVKFEQTNGQLIKRITQGLDEVSDKFDGALGRLDQRSASLTEGAAEIRAEFSVQSANWDSRIQKLIDAAAEQHAKHESMQLAAGGNISACLETSNQISVKIQDLKEAMAKNSESQDKLANVLKELIDKGGGGNLNGQSWSIFKSFLIIILLLCSVVAAGVSYSNYFYTWISSIESLLK